MDWEVEDDLSGVYAWGETQWADPYMAVSSDLVDDLIELLREHLARFQRWPGGSSQTHAFYRLMAGTSSTLTGLLHARAAEERNAGAHELLHLLQRFLERPDAAQHLRAIRHLYDADVVDALLVLHDAKHQAPAK